MGTKVMLSAVRCAFLVLGEPEDYQDNGRYRWSGTALIPYGSPLLATVNAAIEAEAKTKWEKKWAGILENIRTDPKACCFMDGKRKADEYDGFKGHWSLSAHRDRSKGRPLVMDKDKSPIYMPNNEVYEGKGGVIYSGCFVNMQVEIWPQDNKNGKAIRAALLGIQKVRDGDAFGGGAKPDADEFAEVTEGADADDLG